MNKCLLTILALFCFVLRASASDRAHESTQPKQYADTAIYQGMSIKLDIAMPILELARSAGKVQDYEMALNERLANRFYPTLELGYAIADAIIRTTANTNPQIALKLEFISVYGTSLISINFFISIRICFLFIKQNFFYR